MARGSIKDRRTMIKSSSTLHFSLRAIWAASVMSFIVLVVNIFSALSQYPSSIDRRNLRLTTADTVKYYTQDDIMKTSPYFQKFIPRLLVFDGARFQAFGLAHRGTQYFETMRYTYRYIDTVPLLVQALKANFPDRFKPGMPPFELLFSDADSPHSDCVNVKCPTADFAPMILFGSTPKDDSIFPTLRSFPHPVFTHCLFHFKVNGVETCDWPQKPRTDIPWESLIDTVIWRGADWPFLHYHDIYRFEGPNEVLQRMETPEWKNGSRDTILNDLSTTLADKFSPRWRGAIMSARAEGDATPWIDTKFVGGMNAKIHKLLSNHNVDITGERMDADVMSNYKYQIDFGGGGGTTWEGTLTKLLMPGVLFHHETETKDWYYDMMIPWRHYVPIKWDLSDLWSSFSGAQSHQDQMKQISAEGTRLAEYMMSADYMEEVYQELFVNYLGKLVHSYKPPTDGSTWTDMQARYKEKGFDMYSIAVCKERVCSMQCRKGMIEQMLFVNKDKPAGTGGASAQQLKQLPPQQQQMQLPTHPQQPLDPPQWQQASPQHQQQRQATPEILLPLQQPLRGVPVPQQQEPTLPQKKTPAQSDVSTNRYITSEVIPSESLAKSEVRNLASHRAVEPSASVQGTIADKAYSYIAGMTSPEPTPAPVTVPTQPPVPDRSSLYIAGTPKVERTEPPRRAPKQLEIQDRTSSYLV